MTIFIVLPAYNEEQSLPPLLDAIGEFAQDFDRPVKTIVVDDGSSDATAGLALSHSLAAAGSLEVVPHEVNKGLAAAVDTGINAFLERSESDGDIMVTMDADNTHNPAYIHELAERIDGGAGLVICSRFVEGGVEMGVSPFRKLLSRGAKSFMDLLAPAPGVKDISCGYRAYSRKALLRASNIYGAHLVQSTGGAVQAELLLRLIETGARVEEIPFTLRYDKKVGPSKLGITDTIKSYFPLRGIKKQSHAEAALLGGVAGAAPAAAHVAVMICTYNERENIEPLVRRVFRLLPDTTVLVVDDSSPDGTGDAVRALQAEYPNLNLLSREGKLGLGTAITAGINWAAQNGFELVVNMDADFSHDPVTLPQIIEAAREADYVVGARYVHGGGTINWGLHRKILSRGANTFARFALGVPVSDLTTGYRCIRLSRAHELGLDTIPAKGYSYLIAMTFRAYRAGLRISEVPIRFMDRKFGESKMSMNIIEEALMLVIRLRGERKN